MNDFGIINIDKNINPGCVSKLITHTSSYNPIKYQCFIPNLSTLVKQYKGYNGIIITSSTRQYDGFFIVIEKHPTFLLFESKYVCNNSSHDYMTMLMSTKRIVATKHASLIYCGKTHGIIYGNHKNLYQLKLENVHTNNFNFTEIRQNKTNSFANIWYHKWNMHYSNLCDQIFGIQMRKEYSVNWNCSTFDLCSNEWHNIKPFTMKNRSRKRRDFDCIICNDGPNKLIYVVTNFEYVGKYDYNKNYWTKVYSQDTEIGNHFSTFRDQQEYWRSEKNNRPIIWIKDYQPMILYRAQSSYTSKSDGSIISVTCLDMRCNNNNKQWKLLNKVSTEECATPIQCI